MKTAKKISAAAAILSLMAFGNEAHAATASASASANIIPPLELTKTADLDFATIITGASADTVAISATGVRTCGAALTCSATAAAAAFSVAGAANVTYAITLPSSVTISSGSDSMTVDTFSSSKSSNTGTLSTGGADTFGVGATLHVAANQAQGLYSGSFNVGVDYN